MEFSAENWGAPGASSSRGRPGPRETAPIEARDSAHSMVERIIRSGTTSHAEALKKLRAAFPDSPLTVRYRRDLTSALF